MWSGEMVLLPEDPATDAQGSPSLKGAGYPSGAAPPGKRALPV